MFGWLNLVMKCIECGKGTMVSATRDLPYTYKGHSTTIRDVVGKYCSRCSESLHSAKESSRISFEMLEFNKEVNSRSVDPSFVARVRKKLSLDQQRAAEIFGGGANAFSRYENGKTKPPLALVQLLKILDSHPYLIEEIAPTKVMQVKEEAVVKSPLNKRRKVKP